jgi:microcin C transport system substrate-binding protein
MTQSRILFFILVFLVSANTFAYNHKSHAIALHGKPKYKSWFTHFDYTNPKAPKKGSLKLATQGTYDSLNPFIAKGNAANEIGLIYDSLTVQSADEPYTQYGLIARTIEWPDDRTWVKYQLRPEARFHDGKPITALDVKYTFELLMEKGNPVYKTLYADVTEVIVIGTYSIKFKFKHGNNRELILLVGQLPVLPKHFWKDKEFSKSSLEIPLGSSAYKVKSIDVGKNIIFERVKNYWAKNLAVNAGRYNFDELRYDFYRDSTILLEALKAGSYDFRLENVSKQWASGYDGTPIKKGWLKKENIKHENPTGMQCFLLNMRNPLFSDIRVRKALNYAFDYEWTNNTIFYGTYKRNYSYFTNSELASTGLPDADELELLEPLRSQLPGSVFTEPYVLPVTNGSGNNREQLKIAKKLLEEAGWFVKNNVLTNASGEIFAFEFLLYDPSFERIVNPYIKGMKKLGIQASVRRVETSQFINQIRNFEYDIIIHSFRQSTSPGNELMQYWHSSMADVPSSLNIAGIKNPAIDNLIMNVIESEEREELVVATRALDRAMLHNWFVIPQWYIDSHRIAYWDKFSRPDIGPKFDPGYYTALFTWWIDDEKLKQLPKGKHQ